MSEKILKELGFDECVCELPSGFHASVTLVNAQSCQKVVKIISKSCLDEEAAALELQKDIIAYYDELKKINIPTPENDIRIIRNDRGYDLVIISPFCGFNLSETIKHGSEAESLEAASSILSVIGKFFTNRICEKSFELICGLDPKPDNFTRDQKGNVHYIDLMPPRCRKNGRALVEFPAPRSKKGYDLAYFRHFDARGIILVFRTQLCRLRPSLRPQILGLLYAFYEKTLGPECVEYFESFAGNIFNRADRSQRQKIIAEIKEDDMYLFRDIATQLSFENPDRCGKKWLEEIFHLTHFYDDVPSFENARKIKQMLKSV